MDTNKYRISLQETLENEGYDDFMDWVEENSFDDSIQPACCIEGCPSIYLAQGII